jgi:hypothetical protein
MGIGPDLLGMIEYIFDLLAGEIANGDDILAAPIELHRKRL